jgi:spore maturation protein CgeB
LIGLHYQQRSRLVADLRAQGVNVYYDLGPAFDEARALYNSAPIGLNWSSLKDLTARVFELLAMKRLAVVNRVPDLCLFFDDSHLAIFDTHEQAVEKVLYYLEHSARPKDSGGGIAGSSLTPGCQIETVLSDV